MAVLTLGSFFLGFRFSPRLRNTIWGNSVFSSVSFESYTRTCTCISFDPNATEEEIETWLRENVGLATDDLAATKSDDSKKDDADKDKKSDKADKVDDADKTDKSTGDKQILDIDGKRPASSKDKASISDMSVEEIRKRALANL